jgi:DNA polymerase III subunit gamma/tau
MSNWATKYRPGKFGEVVGQKTSVDILSRIASGGWKPPAVMLKGPFGTGKTTLSRIVAKSLLCGNRQGFEPCGTCPSCKLVESDSHPSYTELDAASHGLIDDVRILKDLLAYQSAGSRVICFDESHMLSKQAQDALLKILEEGREGVLFLFATTESNKMLPTIQSRCVHLDLRLLMVDEIVPRLRHIAAQEGVEAEESALRLIASYVRGHLRDAVMLLGQLSETSIGKVTADLVRAYLRLDRYVDIYKFLTITDGKAMFVALEELLCSLAPSELQEMLGQVLLNTQKFKLGITGSFDQVDESWLSRVLEVQGSKALARADQVLSLSMDFATINQALASFGRIFEGGAAGSAPTASGVPVGGAQTQFSAFRKPGK